MDGLLLGTLLRQTGYWKCDCYQNCRYVRPAGRLNISVTVLLYVLHA